MHYLITGANRGIGLELTRQLLARGEHVDATAREPEASADLKALGPASGGRLRIFRCDVGSDSSVRELGAALGDTAIDVVINNAGIMGEMASLEKMDLASALHTIDVNAFGALRVSRAALPMVRRGQRKCLVHITSGMGSIGDNSSGGAYGYRMSKAALNMASKSMSVDLAHEGIVSVVVNPGWVQTDMGGSGAPLPVETSAGNIIALIDRLKMSDTGSFFNHTGKKFEW
jgi:NAD(P)-dependent dehydrogenase (short-subunit alcohol dehydrogenase family)